MAIEQAQIARYKGPGNQSLSFMYYSLKSDTKDDKGPAGTLLEQELRILVNGESRYERKINPIYSRDDILVIVQREAKSWEQQQLNLEQVKAELSELELKLAKK